MPAHYRGRMPLRDHPREYGENYSYVPWWEGRVGSSPRIRGECACELCYRPPCGIIPANTGRMTWPYTVWPPPWDHPREYGENIPALHLSTLHPGSSPRIRGEFFIEYRGILAHGIIPANTGRISGDCLIRPTLRDHPREYGENCRGIRNRRF